MVAVREETEEKARDVAVIRSKVEALRAELWRLNAPGMADAPDDDAATKSGE